MADQKKEPTGPRGKIAGRYDRMAAARQPYIDRARAAAELTIPSLMPPDGWNGSQALPVPYQSTGANGINTLSSKLLNAVLPPQSSFFSIEFTSGDIEKISGDAGLVDKVKQALLKVEEDVRLVVEEDRIRATLGEALKHFLLAGNVMLHLPDSGGSRLYKIDRYVVRRNPVGDMVETITCEDVFYGDLPKTVQDRMVKAGCAPDRADDKLDPQYDTYKLYTRASTSGGVWTYEVEIGGVELKDRRKTYKDGELPFIALRYSKVDGEDYGRGLIEEVYADLNTLDHLRQKIAEAVAAMANTNILVNPGGVTDIRDVERAENLAIIYGREEDVKTLQINRGIDLQYAQAEADRLDRSLAVAFMSNMALRRQGERVTAEEIRSLAQDLESNLGGLFSILAQELQLPLAKRLMARAMKNGRIVKIPSGTVKYVIKTGVEAIGRGQDFQKISALAALAQPLPGAETYLKTGGLLLAGANALSLPVQNLVKSDEEVQQEQQQAMQAQMMQEALSKGTGPAIKAMSDQAMAAQPAPQ